MTVNKFGNYLIITPQQHRLAVPPVVQSIKEPIFKSVCIVNVKGSIKQDSSFYTLENNEKLYEFKMKALVGHFINKDDIIQIIKDIAQQLSKNV